MDPKDRSGSSHAVGKPGGLGDDVVEPLVYLFQRWPAGLWLFLAEKVDQGKQKV